MGCLPDDARREGLPRGDRLRLPLDALGPRPRPRDRRSGRPPGRTGLEARDFDRTRDIEAWVALFNLGLRRAPDAAPARRIVRCRRDGRPVDRGRGHPRRRGSRRPASWSASAPRRRSGPTARSGTRARSGRSASVRTARAAAWVEGCSGPAWHGCGRSASGRSISRSTPGTSTPCASTRTKASSGRGPATAGPGPCRRRIRHRKRPPPERRRRHPDRLRRDRGASADRRPARRAVHLVLGDLLPLRGRLALDGDGLPLPVRPAGPRLRGLARAPAVRAAAGPGRPPRGHRRGLLRRRPPDLAPRGRRRRGRARDGPRQPPGARRRLRRLGAPRRAATEDGHRRDADRAGRGGPHLGRGRIGRLRGQPAPRRGARAS